jgi:hypothetical protein
MSVPRRCTVCDHPDRGAIDRCLVEGESSYALAARYGSLSRAAVERHKEGHLPTKLIRAQAVREHTEADALMRRILDHESRARGILDRAEASGDFNAALGGIREARRTLELLAS